MSAATPSARPDFRNLGGFRKGQDLGRLFDRWPWGFGNMTSSLRPFRRGMDMGHDRLVRAGLGQEGRAGRKIALRRPLPARHDQNLGLRPGSDARGGQARSRCTRGACPHPSGERSTCSPASSRTRASAALAASTTLKPASSRRSEMKRRIRGSSSTRKNCGMASDINCLWLTEQCPTTPPNRFGSNGKASHLQCYFDMPAGAQSSFPHGAPGPRWRCS